MKGRLRGALLGALLAMSAPALAQQPPPTPAPVMPTTVPARVEVAVRVIHAHGGPGGVDPRLAEHARALQRTPFTSFVLVEDARFRVADGHQGQVHLPDGHTVALTLSSHNSTEARVDVRSHRAGAQPVETTLTITRNRAFMYVLRTDDPGAAYLLKVDVRY